MEGVYEQYLESLRETFDSALYDKISTICELKYKDMYKIETVHPEFMVVGDGKDTRFIIYKDCMVVKTSKWSCMNYFGESLKRDLQRITGFQKYGGWDKFVK